MNGTATRVQEILGTVLPLKRQESLGAGALVPGWSVALGKVSNKSKHSLLSVWDVAAFWAILGIETMSESTQCLHGKWASLQAPIIVNGFSHPQSQGGF